ncbi:MAG: nicotinamide mononucleotide transporter [Chitinophagales bacterium]|nr:nicotinamide mononucleotide transporter [Chitinophagales bacterium]
MDLKELFTSQMFAMTVPEIVAAVTGVLSVWFAKKENILVYPVGIVSVLLYVYVFIGVKLYADAGINFYYFIVSIYGWYYWKHGGRMQNKEGVEERPMDTVFDEKEKIAAEKEEASISMQTVGENLIYFLYTAIIALVLGILLRNFTDSDIAWWDAGITAIFFVAMILMAKKKIENWIFWIVGDAAAIPLCIYKDLYFTAVQYLIFVIIAIAGFLAWYKKLQKQYNEQLSA